MPILLSNKLKSARIKPLNSHVDDQERVEAVRDGQVGVGGLDDLELASGIGN
jgi:hypothetical protein